VRSSPTARWNRRGEKVRLYWRANGKNYYVVVGTLSEDDADDLSLRATMWLRGRMECPAEISGSDAVQRYLQALSPAVDRDGWRIDEYLAHLQAVGITRHWFGVNRNVLTEIAAAYASPSEITDQVAQAWMDILARKVTRRGKKPTPKTVSHWRSVLRRYYFWLGVEKNPFSGKKIRLPRQVKYREIVYLSRGERRLVLRLSKNLQGGVGIWVALWTGMRRKEVAQARWSDLSRGSMTMHVGGDRSGRTDKRGSTRDVPLHPALLAYLESLSRSRGRIVTAWRDPAKHEFWGDDADDTVDALKDALEAHAVRIETRGGNHAQKSRRSSAIPRRCAVGTTRSLCRIGTRIFCG